MIFKKTTVSHKKSHLAEKGMFTGLMNILPQLLVGGATAVAFGGAMLMLTDSGDVGQVVDFHNAHVDIGRQASKGASGCSQYSAARLDSRLQDPRFTYSSSDKKFTLVDGKVVAEVGCEKVPKNAASTSVSSAALGENTYYGLYVKYSQLDNAICSDLLNKLANTSWVTVGAYTSDKKGVVVKAYNKDVAEGMAADGSTICNSGDGSNNLVFWERI